MWQEILSVSIWGGIVALDTTAALQILISHPLVSCSMIGLLLGNFPLGFTIGIILELIWLSELPVGAATFSEGNIGSTVASAVAIITFEQTTRISPSIALSLLVGLFIAHVGGRLVILMRQINSYFYNNLLSRNTITEKHVARTHYLGIAFSFLLGALLTAAGFVTFGYFIVPPLVALAPRTVDPIFDQIGAAFLGIGSGVLTYMFFQKQKWWLFVIGIIFGIMTAIL